MGAALTDERNTTGKAGILDPVPDRRGRTGWAWLAGGDGFVLATVPSEASFLGGLGMWVAGMALVSRSRTAARAQEDADELRIRGEVARHPEERRQSRQAAPLSEHG